MSVQHMHLVWEYSQHKGMQLFLLLSIADHCNDEGICYPSIGRLAKKIRRTERTTQIILRQLLDARPAELMILKAGGSKERPDKGHLFKIVIEPHADGVSDQMRRTYKGGDKTLTGGVKVSAGGGEEILTGGVRKSSPGGVRVSADRGEEILTQTIIEPPVNNHHLTATATGSAAAAVGHGEWWDLSVLVAAGKLPAAHRKALSEANPSPGAYVSKYLYALGKAGFKKPPLWAAKQVSENPGAWEGEPYESLAALGPAGVAKVLAWLSADASYPLDLNGSMPLALKLRADLKDKYKKEPAQLFTATADALADLGLASFVQPGELEELVPESIAPAAPALDAWQAFLRTCKSTGELNNVAFDRLARCRLVSSEGGQYVVGVPTRIEYDWLTLRFAAFAKHHPVTYQLQEE